MSMISVYAPTYNSPQEQKDKFYYDLQQGVDSVPENYLLLVLGDFNVRVGSSYSQPEKYQWVGIRGSHGARKMNESGIVLLSFCALIICLSIMNTYV